MTVSPEVLEAVHLTLSGLTATVHAMPERSTLELFLGDGQLLYVCTSSRLEQPGLRAAWTVIGADTPVLLVAGTTATAEAPLPLVTYWHRRRQVRGWLYRAGTFWLAEAAGPRLKVEIDNGLYALTASAGRRAGAVRLRQSATRLRRPIHPLEETP